MVHVDLRYSRFHTSNRDYFHIKSLYFTLLCPKRYFALIKKPLAIKKNKLYFHIDWRQCWIQTRGLSSCIRYHVFFLDYLEISVCVLQTCFLSKTPLRTCDRIFKFTLLICTKLTVDLWICEKYEISRIERAFFINAEYLRNNSEYRQLAVFPVSGNPILWSIASNAHQIIRWCIYSLLC